MTFKLVFLESALKEWKKLEKPIQEQLKKKLAERLEAPRIPKDKISGMQDCYKIKLRSSGIRLVYKVYDDRLVIQIVVIGKRNGFDVYNTMKNRFFDISEK